MMTSRCLDIVGGVASVVSAVFDSWRTCWLRAMSRSKGERFDILADGG